MPVYPDSLFSTYYQQRVTHFRTLLKNNGDIIFLGNSITDGAEWSELFENNHIKNRGISGDITAGVINRLDEVANRKPAKVFLLIGVDDLSRNVKPDSIVKNILFIAHYLHWQTPSTQLFIQSILPVNNIYQKFSTHTDKTGQINQVNRLLQQNATLSNYTFIDIHYNRRIGDREQGDQSLLSYHPGQVADRTGEIRLSAGGPAGWNGSFGAQGATKVGANSVTPHLQVVS